MAADAKRTVNILISVTGDAAAKFQDIATGLKQISTVLATVSASVANAGTGLGELATSLEKISKNVPDLTDFSKAVTKLSKIDSSKLTTFVESAKGLKDLKVSSTFTKMTDGIKSLSGASPPPDLTNFAKGIKAVNSAMSNTKPADLTALATSLIFFAGIKVPTPTKLINLSTGLSALAKVDLGSLDPNKLSSLSAALTTFIGIKGLPASSTFTGFIKGLKTLSGVAFTSGNINKLTAVSELLPKFKDLTTGLPTAKKLTDFSTGLKAVGKVTIPDASKFQQLADGLRAFSGIKGLPSLIKFSESLTALQKVDVSGIANLVKEIDRLTRALTNLSAVAPNLSVFTKVASASKQVASAMTEATTATDKNAVSNKKDAAAAQELAAKEQKLAEATKKTASAFDKLKASIATYTKYRLIADTFIYLKEAMLAGVTAIVEYDQALKDLQAITGATVIEVDQMGEKILEVASRTKFSASEVAEGMRTLGQAGFTAGESITAMQAVSDLATGTMTDLKSTVDLVTTALRVFALDASNAGMVADIFGNAVNRSKLTVDKLRIAMNYVGPIARDVGITLGETSAAMMTLANSGLRASTIGTGLRRVFAELADPSAKLTAAAEKVGVALQDIDPTSNSLQDVISNLGLVVHDTATAFDVFGKRGAAAVLALSSENSQFSSLLATVSKSGTAAAMAATQMEGLGVGIKNVKDRFGVLAISLGKAGLTSLLRGLVVAAKALVTVLTFLSESTTGKFVLQLTAATVAGAALFSVFQLLSSTTLVTTFARVITSLAGVASGFLSATAAALGFQAVTLPAGLAVAGVITGLIVVAELLGTVFEGTRNSIDRLLTQAAEAKKLGDVYTGYAKAIQDYNIATATMDDGKERVDANLRLRASLAAVAEEHGEASTSALLAMQSIDAFSGRIKEGSTAIDDYHAMVAKLADEKLVESFVKETKAMEEQLEVIKKMTKVDYSAAFDVSGDAPMLEDKQLTALIEGLETGEKTWEEYSEYVSSLMKNLNSELNDQQKLAIATVGKAGLAAEGIMATLGKNGVTAARSTTEEMLNMALSLGIIEDTGSKAAQVLKLKFEEMKESITFTDIVDKWVDDAEKGKDGILELTDLYRDHGRIVSDTEMDKVQALDLEKKSIIAVVAELKKQHQADKDNKGLDLVERKKRYDEFNRLMVVYGNKAQAIQAQLSQIEFFQVGKSLAKIAKVRDDELAKNKARFGKNTENHLDEISREETAILDRYAKNEAAVLKTVVDPATITALYDKNAEIATTAFKRQLLNIALLAAKGTISHEAAEEQKLQATLEFNTQSVLAAEKAYADLQALRDKDNSVTDTQMKKALDAVENTKQAKIAAEIASLEAVQKQIEKGQKELEKSKEKEIKTAAKHADSLLKIEEQFNDKKEALAVKLQKALKKIDDKIAKVRKDANKERLDNEKSTKDSIIGLQSTLEDKLRALKQKGMSDSERRADISKQQLEKQRQAADDIAKGARTNDAELIKRGVEKAKQAEGLIDDSKSYNEQAAKLTQLTKLQIDAEKALKKIANWEIEKQKRIEINKLIKDKQIATKNEADGVEKAAEAQAKSLEGLKKSIAEEGEFHVNLYKTVQEAEKARHELEMKNIDAEIAKLEEKQGLYTRLIDSIESNQSSAPAPAAATGADTGTGSKGATQAYDLIKKEATEAKVAVDKLEASMSVVRDASNNSVEFKLQLSTTEDVDQAIAAFKKETARKLEEEPLRTKAEVDTSEAITKIKALATEYYNLYTKDTTRDGRVALSLLAENAQTAREKLAEVSAEFAVMGTAEGDQGLQDKVTFLNAMKASGIDTKDAMGKLSEELDGINNRSLAFDYDEGFTIVDDLNNKITGVREDIQSNPVVIGAELGVSGLNTLRTLNEIDGLVENFKDAKATEIELKANADDFHATVDKVEVTLGEVSKEPIKITVELDTTDVDEGIQDVSSDAEDISEDPVLVGVAADVEPFEDEVSSLNGVLPEGLEVPLGVDTTEVDNAFNMLNDKATAYTIPVSYVPGTVQSPWVPLSDGIASITKQFESISDITIEVPIMVDSEDLDKLIIIIEEWNKEVEVKIITIDEDNEFKKAKAIHEGLVNKVIELTLKTIGFSTWQTALTTYNSLRDKKVTITTYHKNVTTKAAGGFIGPQEYAAGGDVFKRLPSPYISRGGGKKDDVPAMLMQGEFVLKKSAVAKYGKKFLYAMNMGMLNFDKAAAYAKGGIVQNLGGIQHNMTFPSFFKSGGVVDQAKSAAFMVGRQAQLAMNPSAPFINDGVTYNVNAPSFHNHVGNKVNNIKSRDGKSRALGLIKSFSQLVPKMAAGGNVSSLMSQYEEEKDIVTDMYDEDIDYARENGDEEQAYLLEMEKIQLQEIAAELAITLQEIRADYQQEMLDSTNEFKEDVIEYEEEKDDVALDYREALSDLNKERADIERDYISEKNDLERELSKSKRALEAAETAFEKNGYVTYLDKDYFSKSGNSRFVENTVRSGSYESLKVGVAEAKADIQNLNEDLVTSKLHYTQDLDHIDSKEEAEEFRYSTGTSNANNRITRATTAYKGQTSLYTSRAKQDEENEVASAKVDVNMVKAETAHEVSSSKLETGHDVRKLEMELHLELLHLRQTYDELIRDEQERLRSSATSTYSQSSDSSNIGIKYWLNKGGPVGYPKGKKRWEDSVGAMLTPGEYVISERAVQHYGADFMEALNKREVDPEYSDFPAILGNPKMVSTPTTLNGVTYHVNAPSFHENLATRTHDISTAGGKAHAQTLVSLFSDAIPHMAAGGSIGTTERQLSFEVANITQEYGEKIRYARESGNDHLAYILEVEKAQLEMIAEELDFTLKNLEQERDFALQEAEADYDEGMLDNSIDTSEALYDLDEDKFDAKNAMEDRLLDAQEAIDNARAELIDANADYAYDLGIYNSSVSSATSSGNAVTDAKKNSLHRQIDGWITDQLQRSSSYADPYKYREDTTPDWRKLENLITARKYGSTSSITTWGASTEARWLNTLANYKVDWGTILDEESTAERERNDLIGSPPSAVNQERYANVITRAEQSKIAARERYNTLLGFYTTKEDNINAYKVSADARTTASYNNDVSTAERSYSVDSNHATVEAGLESQEVEREAAKDYKDREDEMIHEIRLLEIELAKALFDLKKEYGASGDGASVKHFLNRGGSIGYPSGAKQGIDSVRAMLTPGEYVISEPAVRRFGVDFFDKLNKMKIPSLNFNDGGMVPGGVSTSMNDSISEQFLGTVNLGVNNKSIPVKTDLALAKTLIKEFKKMGMSLA